MEAKFLDTREIDQVRLWWNNHGQDLPVMFINQDDWIGVSSQEHGLLSATCVYKAEGIDFGWMGWTVINPKATLNGYKSLSFLFENALNIAREKGCSYIKTDSNSPMLNKVIEGTGFLTGARNITSYYINTNG